MYEMYQFFQLATDINYDNLEISHDKKSVGRT